MSTQVFTFDVLFEKDPHLNAVELCYKFDVIPFPEPLKKLITSKALSLKFFR